jgi:putative addiction module killer protein
VANAKTVLIYTTNLDEEPLSNWLEAIDKTNAARILQRLERLKEGNYGDHKNLGEGIYELRFFFGSGYRVYFAEDGNTIVVLLCGGDKKSQTKDIAKARGYWKDYLKRKEEREKESDKDD